jgi:allophanate hydrolase subunit 1
LAEIKGIVRSYRSLLIYYDSNGTSFESLRDRVRGMLSWSVLAEIAKMAETGDQAKH